MARLMLDSDETLAYLGRQPQAKELLNSYNETYISEIIVNELETRDTK